MNKEIIIPAKIIKFGKFRKHIEIPKSHRDLIPFDTECIIIAFPSKIKQRIENLIKIIEMEKKK